MVFAQDFDGESVRHELEREFIEADGRAVADPIGLKRVLARVETELLAERICLDVQIGTSELIDFAEVIFFIDQGAAGLERRTRVEREEGEHQAQAESGRGTHGGGPFRKIHSRLSRVRSRGRIFGGEYITNWIYIIYCILLQGPPGLEDLGGGGVVKEMTGAAASLLTGRRSSRARLPGVGVCEEGSTGS